MWTFADSFPETNGTFDFERLPRNVWACIMQFTFATDIIVCARVCKAFRHLSLDEELWRTKFFQDCDVCDLHKAQSARQTYLDMASDNLHCA